jgi:hypothetical protein
MAAIAALLRNKSGELKGQDSVGLQNLLSLLSLHLCSAHWKIPARRFDIVPRTVVALDEQESLAVFGPRVIWLTGNFCRSWVLGTNMRCELLVALPCEVRLHLVDGLADEGP